MTAWILPVKCALKYKPPVLILVYKDEKTGKLRRRSMPLRGFAATTDVSSYVEELRQSANKHYVNSIAKTQLFSLLQRLKLAQGCESTSDIPQNELDPLSAMSSLQNAPLLKLEARNNEEQFTQWNELNSQHGGSLPVMSGRLLKRTLLPINKKPNPFQSMDSLRSVGDTSVKYEPLNDPVQRDVKSGADLTSLKSKSRESIQSSCSPIEEELEDGGAGACQVESEFIQMLDLNTVTDDELQQKKAEMDVLFEVNKIKPGDPEYVYDKEVEFQRKEIDESGWDSDSSSALEL